MKISLSGDGAELDAGFETAQTPRLPRLQGEGRPRSRGGRGPGRARPRARRARRLRRRRRERRLVARPSRSRPCRGCSESAIAFIEQPVDAADLDGMREVRALGLPVVADEAVYTTEDVRRIAAAGAADVVSVYVGKSSGLERAVESARVAAELGLEVVIGANGEMGLGAAAQLHVACACEQLGSIPCGITGQHFYEEEPTLARPLDIDGAARVLPDGPGSVSSCARRCCGASRRDPGRAGLPLPGGARRDSRPTRSPSRCSSSAATPRASRSSITAARRVLPRQARVSVLTTTTTYFEPERARYGELVPVGERAARTCASALLAFRAACERAGLGFRAWIVALHHDALATALPGAAARTLDGTPERDRPLPVGPGIGGARRRARRRCLRAARARGGRARSGSLPGLGAVVHAHARSRRRSREPARLLAPQCFCDCVPRPARRRRRRARAPCPRVGGRSRSEPGAGTRSSNRRSPQRRGARRRRIVAAAAEAAHAAGPQLRVFGSGPPQAGGAAGLLAVGGRRGRPAPPRLRRARRRRAARALPGPAGARRRATRRRRRSTGRPSGRGKHGRRRRAPRRSRRGRARALQPLARPGRGPRRLPRRPPRRSARRWPHDGGRRPRDDRRRTGTSSSPRRRCSRSMDRLGIDVALVSPPEPFLPVRNREGNELVAAAAAASAGGCCRTRSRARGSAREAVEELRRARDGRRTGAEARSGAAGLRSPRRPRRSADRVRGRPPAGRSTFARARRRTRCRSSSRGSRPASRKRGSCMGKSGATDFSADGPPALAAAPNLLADSAHVEWPTRLARLEPATRRPPRRLHHRRSFRRAGARARAGRGGRARRRRARRPCSAGRSRPCSACDRRGGPAFARPRERRPRRGPLVAACGRARRGRSGGDRRRAARRARARTASSSCRRSRTTRSASTRPSSPAGRERSPRRSGSGPARSARCIRRTRSRRSGRAPPSSCAGHELRRGDRRRLAARPARARGRPRPAARRRPRREHDRARRRVPRERAVPRHPVLPRLAVRPRDRDRRGDRSVEYDRFPGCSRAFGVVERGLRERSAIRDGLVGRAIAQLVRGRRRDRRGRRTARARPRRASLHRSRLLPLRSRARAAQRRAGRSRPRSGSGSRWMSSSIASSGTGGSAVPGDRVVHPP